MILFTLCCAAGCFRKRDSSGVPPADPRIVGSWTLQGGDYPLTDEYRADGTLVQHVFGKTTEPMPFRIEGKFLVVGVKQDDGKVSEDKTEFSLTGDTLTFVDSPTSKRVFLRQR